MASSNPLRPQNRTQQDQAGILKNQELKTKSASSKRGSENLDPNASGEAGKGVSKLKGISRLPVLAKSLQPALSALSQNPSHNSWEQRPLTSKAQKKRTCTKPVPFNLSQSRTQSQRNTGDLQGKAPLMPSTRLTPGAKVMNLNPSAKTETPSHKATTPGVLRAQANKSQRLQPGSHVEYKASNQDSTDVHPPSHESGCCSHTDLSSRLGSITLTQSKLPEDSGLSHLCKTSLFKVDVNSDNQAPKDKHCFPSTTQRHVITEAVHSVLTCEGSSAVGAQCMMPRLSTCPPGQGTSNNLPQRVVKKSHGVDVTTDKAGLFSPDPSALRSILQSDGTRLGEHVGATPRASACPTGRGTSIYSVRAFLFVFCLSNVSSPSTSCFRPFKPMVLCCGAGAVRTPVMKWTPQRVAKSKPQSMRKLCTTQKMSSLRGSPGLRESHDPSTGLLVCQEGEDVVQRLFEDQEQMEDDQIGQDDITSQQLLNSHQTTEAQSKIKENSDTNHCHTENEGKKTVQPFIQAAHRGSVIVFSSSQRLGSDRSQDTLKNPGISAPLQLCLGQLTSHNAIPLQSDQSNGSWINPSLDLPKQSQSKAPAVKQSTAMSALRRRHTPLEEMILDEECAMYTSRLLSCPLQTRCGNPVATTLLFQDSTCFLPIGLSSPIRLSPVPSGSFIRA
uniref:Trophinin associated protein n=1 Tax=Cyprinus carpio carpio TaxID=630221 RepID=A0A8C1EQF2_CYPCA